jgi:hypothetical protein
LSFPHEEEDIANKNPQLPALKNVTFTLIITTHSALYRSAKNGVLVSIHAEFLKLLNRLKVDVYLLIYKMLVFTLQRRFRVLCGKDKYFKAV